MYFADECISQGMSTLNINRMTVWEELDLSLYPRSTFNIEWKIDTKRRGSSVNT